MSVLQLNAVGGPDDADGALVLTAEGEIDLETAPRLSELITSAFAEGQKKIVLDLGSVTFIDSSGLTALVVAQASAVEANAELILRSVTRSTYDLLLMTGLDQVLTIEQ